MRRVALALFLSSCLTGVAAAQLVPSFNSRPEPTAKVDTIPATPDVAKGNLVFLLNGPTKAGVTAAYTAALREIAPTIPLVLFATLRDQMDAALGSQRAITFLSTPIPSASAQTCSHSFRRAAYSPGSCLSMS